MKDSDFDTIFLQPVLDVSHPKEIPELIDKKIKEQKKFFLDNFKKDKNLKFKIFKKIGYGYLLENKDNLDTLNKILNNSNFIKLFKNSNMTLDSVCKIIFTYSNASDYFLENLSLHQKKIEKNFSNIEKNYIDLKDNCKDILDFNSWYSRKITSDLNVAINKIVNSKQNFSKEDIDIIRKEIHDNLKVFFNIEAIFYDYFTDAQYLMKAQNPLKTKEKNLRLNYFVRELYNLLNTDISFKIICELCSIIFNHELDETGVRNILKNSNTDPINLQITTEIMIGEDNNIVINHIKLKEKFKF